MKNRINLVLFGFLTYLALLFAGVTWWFMNITKLLDEILGRV